MYSIGILSTILLALVAITNALQCRPVTCMLHCSYGFDVDTQGCPICTCRRSSNVCVEPIYGYNCGSIDHRDCPNSHECQLDFSGLSGQCCLKRVDSSTPSPQSTIRLTATNTTTTGRPTTTKPRSTTTKPRSTTTKPKSTTTKPKSTTRRVFNRMLSVTTGATRGSASTTQR